MQVSLTHQECIKVSFEEVNFKTISGGPWDPPFSSVVKRSGTDKLALPSYWAKISWQLVKACGGNLQTHTQTKFRMLKSKQSPSLCLVNYRLLVFLTSSSFSFRCSIAICFIINLSPVVLRHKYTVLKKIYITCVKQPV